MHSFRIFFHGRPGHSHDRSTDHCSCHPAELQALSRAKLSLTQAIETAERHGTARRSRPNSKPETIKRRATRSRSSAATSWFPTRWTRTPGRCWGPAMRQSRSCLPDSSRMMFAVHGRRWRRPSASRNSIPTVKLSMRKSIARRQPALRRDRREIRWRRTGAGDRRHQRQDRRGSLALDASGVVSE